MMNQMLSFYEGSSSKQKAFPVVVNFCNICVFSFSPACSALRVCHFNGEKLSSGPSPVIVSIYCAKLSVFHYILWVIDILHRLFHRSLPFSPRVYKKSAEPAQLREVRLMMFYSKGATAFDKMPRSFRFTGSAFASSGVMIRHFSWVFRKSSRICGMQAQPCR